MSQSLLFEVFFPITPEEAQEWVEKSQSLLFEVFFPITGKILVELFVLEESQSLLFEVFFPMLTTENHPTGKFGRNPFFLRSFFL